MASLGGLSSSLLDYSRLLLGILLLAIGVEILRSRLSAFCCSILVNIAVFVLLKLSGAFNSVTRSETEEDESTKKVFKSTRNSQEHVCKTSVSSSQEEQQCNEEQEHTGGIESTGEVVNASIHEANEKYEGITQEEREAFTQAYEKYEGITQEESGAITTSLIDALETFSMDGLETFSMEDFNSLVESYIQVKKQCR